MDLLRLVNPGAIANMPLLTVLDVSGSKELGYIDREAFGGLPRLQTLHLHACNLSSLEWPLLAHLTKLKTLTVHDNPWHCDCNLDWLIQTLRYTRNNIVVPKATTITCNEPAPLRGQHIAKMHPVQVK